MRKQKNLFVLLRLSMSFIFLWAFFDKLLGLGFSTTTENSWISGSSPTAGFLSNAVRGPFADFFQGLAGVAVVDWLFMLGLLGVGLSLLFKKHLKLGVLSGSVMLLLMYTALLLPENNPFVDDHIIYILVLLLIGSRGEDGV